MSKIEIFGIPYLKKGSGIHIKKKNRGKFTDYCGGEVTDKCILRAKKSGNSKLVKRAVFALNARKWKHALGGIIKCLDGTPLGGVIYNIPLEKRPEQKLPKASKKMADWLDKWNQETYKTGLFEEQLGNGEMEKLAKRRRTVYMTNSPIDFGHLFARNTWQGNDINSYKSSEFREDYYPKARDFAKTAASEIGVLGLYNPEAHVAYALPYNKAAQEEELTHASQAKPQEAVISKILGKPIDEYLDDPSEVYYRLMDFRKDNNLSPNKRDYTVEDVRKMLEPFKVIRFNQQGVPTKNGMGLTQYETIIKDDEYNLFNRYSPEQITRLLNEVASNNINTNINIPNIPNIPNISVNNSYFAKKGTKIHKPFGHRSILDNGLQSTKLLKNLRNVYGL